jgi:hypothetical protein
MRKKPQWIKTSERMPRPYAEVYALHKDGGYRLARLSKSEGGCWQLATFLIDTKRPGYAWGLEDVIAWCPIKQPPAVDGAA